MSSKSKKDDQKKGDSLLSTVLTTLTAMLAKHKAALLAEFNTAFSKLEAKLDNIRTTVLDHQQRLSSLETFAKTTSQDMKTVGAKLALVSEVNSLIWRTCRNNVRIVGLPENVEGAHPTAFFSQLLVEVLGEQILDSGPELDRAC